MADALSIFKLGLLGQLFFGICITLIVHAMPPQELNFLDTYTDLNNQIDLNATASDIQGSLEQQTNIPIVEIGALVFYSGNIMVDMIANSLFAIPEMFGLLVAGVQNILNIDSYLVGVIQAMATVGILLFYLLAIIEFLTGLRAGRFI
jgi:hypothetical protein